MELLTIWPIPSSYTLRWPVGPEAIPLRPPAQESWSNGSLGRNEYQSGQPHLGSQFPQVL